MSDMNLGLIAPPERWNFLIGKPPMNVNWDEVQLVRNEIVYMKKILYTYRDINLKRFKYDIPIYRRRIEKIIKILEKITMNK